MPLDSDKHDRRSTRLDGYDYAQEGAYFVTICTQHRECLFGEVIEDRVELNPYGEIVRDEWLQTAIVRPYVLLDAFVVMPNHVHGIIVITGERVGATRRVIHIRLRDNK